MDQFWMQQAFALAKKAEKQAEVPVGAVVVRKGECIGQGYNQVIQRHDACAHAEMLAIQAAMQHVANERLPTCTVYVTLEPCVMCMGALLQARIARLVFGARDYRAGAAGSVLNLANGFKAYPAIQVDEGIMEEACSTLLEHFFKQLRRSGNDIP